METTTDEAVDLLSLTPDMPGGDNSTTVANPRVIGRPFPKGVAQNPGGRHVGVGNYIRSQTSDGIEIIDMVLKVLRGRFGGKVWRHPKYRLWAAEYLSDRIWGKAVVQAKIEGVSEIKITVEGLESLVSGDSTAQLVDGESDDDPDTIKVQL